MVLEAEALGSRAERWGVVRSLVLACTFSLYCHKVRAEALTPLHLLIRACALRPLHLLMGACALGPSPTPAGLPEAPPLNSLSWGLGLRHRDLGGSFNLVSLYFSARHL